MSYDQNEFLFPEHGQCCWNCQFLKCDSESIIEGIQRDISPTVTIEEYNKFHSDRNDLSPAKQERKHLYIHKDYLHKNTPDDAPASLICHHSCFPRMLSAWSTPEELERPREEGSCFFYPYSGVSIETAIELEKRAVNRREAEKDRELTKTAFEHSKKASRISTYVAIGAILIALASIIAPIVYDNSKSEYMLLHQKVNNISIKACSFLFEGLKTKDVPTLRQAVLFFSLALDNIDKNDFPLDWAMMQHNLAYALNCTGRFEKGTVSLKMAISAYRMALKSFDELGISRPDTKKQLKEVEALFEEREKTAEGKTTE